jgi:putative transcriptional regulator
MAIRVKLDHLLLDRRLSLTELAERMGITVANLSVLKTNKARAIRFSTLDALCRELDCQPGELLEWTCKESEDGSHTKRHDGVSPPGRRQG